MLACNEFLFKTITIMSIIRFIKNWTLPVAIATGSALYLLFAFVPALDAAGLFFKPVMASLLPIFMFFTLFVVFCKVDFKKLRPVRWHLWLSLFQIMTVLVLTWLVIGFKLTGDSLVLVEAMLVCVIGPCASAAPVVTQKLGGNLEQMTTYTFLSNFITALFVPVCFPLIDKAADVSFFTAFTLILYKVATVLVAPMALAWAVKHLTPRFHRWIVGIKDLGGLPSHRQRRHHLQHCPCRHIGVAALRHRVDGSSALHHAVWCRPLHRPLFRCHG